MTEALPIDAVMPQIRASLQREPALVLEAPPGAGKTTRVPPALLELVEGEVIVLEPRRIAARAAARHVGAGYQIRFDKSGPPGTRLWYVTEGILARRLFDDPQLQGVGAVVLDEFHERHLPADVSLALAQRLLPRIKLVVMSATLDAAAIGRHLRAPVIRSEGRRFPVEIEYRDKPGRIGEQVAAAVRKITVPGTQGDVLVFLPGAAEIRQSAQACEELARHRALLLVPLHGDLSPEEQDRALKPGAQRKIILSTNVAETSVTVPGVTAVIDSGLARIATHSPWSGLPSLTVQKISRASAEQRAGRAGRTAPGRALRLYAKHDFESRPDHHPPEIERLDLASLLLDLRAAGIDPETLPWLDAPPAPSLHNAAQLLQRLGLLRDGRITAEGRAAARLPLHPRLSRLAVGAAQRGHARDGARIAALLSERDSQQGDVLELIERSGNARVEEQLLRLLPREGPRRESRDAALQQAVLGGFPDRVAKKRGDELLLSSGGSARLVAHLDAPLLVALDAEERGRGNVLVRIASAIEPEWLLDSARDETELVWEPARERVEAVTRLRYDALVLEETRRAPREEELPEAARLLLEHAPPQDATELIVRTALIARHCPESGIEILTEAQVAAARREAATGLTSLAELRDAKLALLPPQTLALVDRLAPESVLLPGGRRVRVEYAPGQPPAVHSRLQDFFGMSRGPSICNGRLPLTLHLNAPNGRAQQVTQDLAGFWQRHYPAVRKELMRKYPRHAWPEDGATAQPPQPVKRRT